MLAITECLSNDSTVWNMRDWLINHETRWKELVYVYDHSSLNNK